MTAVFIVLITAACLLVPSRNVHAQPVTLRYGQIPSTIKTVSALQFYIAQRKGFFAREGINEAWCPSKARSASKDWAR